MDFGTCCSGFALMIEFIIDEAVLNPHFHKEPVWMCTLVFFVRSTRWLQLRGCLGVFGKFVFFPFPKGLLVICCASEERHLGLLPTHHFMSRYFLLVSHMWIWGASKQAYKENIKSLLHLHLNINVSSLRTCMCDRNQKMWDQQGWWGIFFWSGWYCLLHCLLLWIGSWFSFI